MTSLTRADPLLFDVEFVPAVVVVVVVVLDGVAVITATGPWILPFAIMADDESAPTPGVLCTLDVVVDEGRACKC